MGARRGITLRLNVPNKEDHPDAQLLRSFEGAVKAGDIQGVELVNETEGRPGAKRDLIMSISLPLEEEGETLGKLLEVIGYADPAKG